MTLSIIICYIICAAVLVAAEEYHFEWSTTHVKYKNALVSDENPFFCRVGIKFHNFHDIIFFSQWHTLVYNNNNTTFYDFSHVTHPVPMRI